MSDCATTMAELNALGRAWQHRPFATRVALDTAMERAESIREVRVAAEHLRGEAVAL